MCLILLMGITPISAKTYMTQQAFLDQVFSNSDDKAQKKTLWLNKALQQKIKSILEHKYPKLRLTYWQSQGHTVWFIDEIGKERPISFGISVKDDQVQQIKVLAFRESRGWEIRNPAYESQFQTIGLNEKGRLNRHVDGITGATMSVTAMKKVTRMALMLAKLVNQ